jgi:cbb3-type cytochrome c oxidase subunit III
MRLARHVKLLALAATAGAAMAIAAAPAQAQDAADGKKLFMTKTCIACHGKDGAKAIQAYPNLAGQDAKYLLQQMKDIKAGTREGSKDQTGNPRSAGMKAVMHLVSDEEMKTVADWLAALPAPEPKPAVDDAARIKQGEDLYKKSGCPSCHGPEGKKPLPAHPGLAGMKAEYASFQMKDIRDGARVNGKSKTMVNFVKKLDDAQIQLIADYLSTVKR